MPFKNLLSMSLPLDITTGGAFCRIYASVIDPFELREWRSKGRATRRKDGPVKAPIKGGSARWPKDRARDGEE